MLTRGRWRLLPRRGAGSVLLTGGSSCSERTSVTLIPRGETWRDFVRGWFPTIRSRLGSAAGGRRSLAEGATQPLERRSQAREERGRSESAEFGGFLRRWRAHARLTKGHVPGAPDLHDGTGSTVEARAHLNPRRKPTVFPGAPFLILCPSLGRGKMEGRSRSGNDPHDLEQWVQDWGEAGDVETRRALEGRIFEALSDGLRKTASDALRRIRAGPDSVSTEEVVQEVGVQLPRILIKYLESSRSDGNVHAYVARSTRNIASDLVRRPRREKELRERFAASHPSRLERSPTTPSRAEMRQEFNEMLDNALAAFEPIDSQILRRRIEGATVDQIGEELDLPRTTVQYRWEQANARLRRIVERGMGGNPFEA